LKSGAASRSGFATALAVTLDVIRPEAPAAGCGSSRAIFDAEQLARLAFARFRCLRQTSSRLRARAREVVVVRGIVNEDAV